jgi:VanZ family protein
MSEKESKLQQTPDPKSHFRVSLIKSLLRIGGFNVLLVSMKIGVALLVIAEILGILEEII